jgi:energy-coupling factor transporter transmembrane protein EcfT
MLLCCLFQMQLIYKLIPTVVGWCIAILRFFFTIIMAPKRSLWDILLVLCLLLLLLFLLFHFFIFLAFLPFPWQRLTFWKNQPLSAQLHMAYDIPTGFHKVWSRHLREKGRTKLCQKKSESVGQTLPQLPWKQKRGI